jgi:CelD/BcsL family acetyltransferase involved in cellulose biosynthesis
MLAINTRQIATTLAALRMLQDALETDPDAVHRLEHFWSPGECLTTDEIDELCESLNMKFDMLLERSRETPGGESIEQNPRRE